MIFEANLYNKLIVWIRWKSNWLKIKNFESSYFELMIRFSCNSDPFPTYLQLFPIIITVRTINYYNSIRNFNC